MIKILSIIILLFTLIQCGDIINEHSTLIDEDKRTLNKDYIYVYQFNTQMHQAIFLCIILKEMRKHMDTSV